MYIASVAGFSSDQSVPICLFDGMHLFAKGRAAERRTSSAGAIVETGAIPLEVLGQDGGDTFEDNLQVLRRSYVGVV